MTTWRKRAPRTGAHRPPPVQHAQGAARLARDAEAARPIWPPTGGKQVELAIDQAESTRPARPRSPTSPCAEGWGTPAARAAAGGCGGGGQSGLRRARGLPARRDSPARRRERGVRPRALEPRIRAATGARLAASMRPTTGVWRSSHASSPSRRRDCRDLYGDGVSIPAALDRLNADPAYQVRGRMPSKAWMQETSDRALDDLHGAHFDIPDRCIARDTPIAPQARAPSTTPARRTFLTPGRVAVIVPDGTDVFHTWQRKDRLPRGRARPSPTARHGYLRQRFPQRLATQSLLELRSR